MREGRACNWNVLEGTRIVAILRVFGGAAVRELVAAACRGGVRNIEVTMNSPGALDSIRAAIDETDDTVNVGAGTVCSIDDLDQALGVGASFIVTPVLLPEVIGACKERKVPIMPGALTPTEIFQAWELAAELVKVFPCHRLSASYLTDAKGPLPHLRMMPTGGIDAATSSAVRPAGAVGPPALQRDEDQPHHPCVHLLLGRVAGTGNAPAEGGANHRRCAVVPPRWPTGPPEPDGVLPRLAQPSLLACPVLAGGLERRRERVGGAGGFLPPLLRRAAGRNDDGLLPQSRGSLPACFQRGSDRRALNRHDLAPHGPRDAPGENRGGPARGTVPPRPARLRDKGLADTAVGCRSDRRRRASGGAM